MYLSFMTEMELLSITFFSLPAALRHHYQSSSAYMDQQYIYIIFQIAEPALESVH